MLVVGGTYQELCRFPPIDDLYGSGLRGVCAISNITNSRNHFRTYCAEDRATIEAYADTYDFDFEIEKTQQTIQFDYLHNHAEPVIRPDNPDPPKEEIGPIENDAILRFGMVEGTSIVQGTHVVYDPQSPDFEVFHENGSEADHLALVLNEGEGRSVTGQEDPEMIVQHLCTGDFGCDVAVLKQGASGALVGTVDGIHDVPVYRTPTVRNIGSGDIFTSVFAAYWADQRQSAVDAAQRASLATAFYSYAGSLPIPKSPKEALEIDLPEISPDIQSDPPTIYLAGPFFTIGQFYLIEEIYSHLKNEGAKAFSPYHDVGPARDAVSSGEIASRDLEGLENSDVVLALLDEEDPGTLFEIGYARSIDIPVVAYQNNPEQSHHMMLEGTDCQIHEDVSSAIFNAIWSYYD